MVSQNRTTMVTETLLLVVVSLWLAYKNWVLAEEIQDLHEQKELANELILNMAEELQELGSPNVKVVEREK